MRIFRCLHVCWVLWYHPSLFYYVMMTVVLLAEDDAPSKMAKVEFPSSVLPSMQYPPHSTLGTMQPVYGSRLFSKII